MFQYFTGYSPFTWLQIYTYYIKMANKYTKKKDYPISLQ